MVSRVRCPDCGALVEVPQGAKPGDVVECPNCAGHLLRLRQEAGVWIARLAHRVSCPGCDALVTLPEEAKPGDVITCCGRDYALTFEFGAFAAEEISR
jgi:uncharacterized paraquat-inducible protein A